MSDPLVNVQAVSVTLGGNSVLSGVSLTLAPGRITTLIGPNGAGKTTVFNCLTGFYKPSGGKIIFDGREIQGMPGFKVARRGMIRTFQHVRLFKEMTVVENLLVAQHQHINTNLLSGLFKTPGYRRTDQEALVLEWRISRALPRLQPQCQRQPQPPSP